MDIMQLDSENITPPSSPILGLGYSGGDDEQSIISMCFFSNLELIRILVMYLN